MWHGHHHHHHHHFGGWHHRHWFGRRHWGWRRGPSCCLLFALPLFLLPLLFVVAVALRAL